MDEMFWEKSPTRRRPPEPSREQLPLEFVAEAPEGEPFDALVKIAADLATNGGYHGATVGEAVYEYERNGRRVGGVSMEDKAKEQRQTSWLPRVMKAAGLVATDRVRPSPVERHHKHRHSVWVLPAFANQETAA